MSADSPTIEVRVDTLTGYLALTRRSGGPYSAADQGEEPSETHPHGWRTLWSSDSPEPADQGEERNEWACNPEAGLHLSSSIGGGGCKCDTPAPPADQGKETTTLTVTDTPKMIRETLAVAQSRIGNSPLDEGRKHEHIDRLQRLIDECERHRPLGRDGKHGDLHTDTCGCHTPAPPADRTPDATTLPDTPWTTVRVTLDNGDEQRWYTFSGVGMWMRGVNQHIVRPETLARVQSYTILAEPPKDVHAAYASGYDDAARDARIVAEKDAEPASGQPDGETTTDAGIRQLIAGSEVVELVARAEDRAVERIVAALNTEGDYWLATPNQTFGAFAKRLADRIAQGGQPQTEKEEGS